MKPTENTRDGWLKGEFLELCLLAGFIYIQHSYIYIYILHVFSLQVRRYQNRLSAWVPPRHHCHR